MAQDQGQVILYVEETHKTLADDIVKWVGETATVTAKSAVVYTAVNIEGESLAVETAHFKLAEYLANAKIPFVRIADSVGSMVRAEAYPMLQEAETHVRQFIHRVLIPFLGFDWWDMFATITLRSTVEGHRAKHSSTYHSELEYLFFEDLLTIIELEVKGVPHGSSLTADEVVRAVYSRRSIDEVRRELEPKLTSTSLWSSAFYLFFKSRKQWEEVKSDLQLLVNLRHKVMHFRPMRLRELEIVREVTDRVKQNMSRTFKALPLEKTEQLNADWSVNWKQLQVAMDSYVKKIDDTLEALAPYFYGMNVQVQRMIAQANKQIQPSLQDFENAMKQARIDAERLEDLSSVTIFNLNQKRKKMLEEHPELATPDDSSSTKPNYKSTKESQTEQRQDTE